MQLPQLAALTLATAFATAACGSTSGQDLFSGSTGTGIGGDGAGGTVLPFGAGGSPTGAGGFPTGSSGGDFGNGGFDSLGGTGGSGNGGQLAAGSGGQTQCDLSGTWGTYIVAPVNWPKTDPLVLIAGQGNLQQWNLSHQQQNGASVATQTVPCRVILPDLQGDLASGYSKFGIRFPDSLFDANGIPWVNFTWTVSFGGPDGYSIQTDPFGTVVGALLDNAATAPWPAVPALNLQDQDMDGKPGVTVVPAAGTGYSFPPTAIFGLGADSIYIAERTVSTLSAKVVSCDEVQGSVALIPEAAVPGINSSVVGCRKTDGTECTATEAGFVNGVRPQFSPTGPGTMVAVRLADGATCADVRTRFPQQ